MAINIDELTEELLVHAPGAVDVPRGPSDNEVRVSTIQRWAEDGAGKINQHRGATTLKEATIVTTGDDQGYTLPPDVRKVKYIRRSTEAPISSHSILGIPQGSNLFGLGGALPSGQEMSPALDLIGRQRLNRMRMEDEFEMFGTEIRLLFPVDEGETLVVVYEAIDRDLANVPDDYFNLLLIYLRIRNLDWFFEKRGANLSVRGDQILDQGMVSLRLIRNDLERQWQSGLEAIGPEVD